MTSLADQIRDRIQTQHQRQSLIRALNVCHTALFAVLDEHQPCEPPRQLLCNGCHHMEPCPTKVAIGAALGITDKPRTGHFTPGSVPDQIPPSEVIWDDDHG